MGFYGPYDLEVNRAFEPGWDPWSALGPEAYPYVFEYAGGTDIEITFPCGFDLSYGDFDSSLYSYNYVSSEGPFYHLADAASFVFEPDFSGILTPYHGFGLELFESPSTGAQTYNRTFISIRPRGLADGSDPTPTIRMRWERNNPDYTPVASAEVQQNYDEVAQRFLKVDLSADSYVSFHSSPDGATWTQLWISTQPVPMRLGIFAFTTTTTVPFAEQSQFTRNIHLKTLQVNTAGAEFAVIGGSWVRLTRYVVRSGAWSPASLVPMPT